MQERSIGKLYKQGKNGLESSIKREEMDYVSRRQSVTVVVSVGSQSGKRMRVHLGISRASLYCRLSSRSRV